MKWVHVLFLSGIVLHESRGANPSHLVLDQKVAEEVFAGAKAWCHKTLSGYGSLPEGNISIVLEDRKTFAKLTSKHASERPDINFRGHTTRVKTNGHVSYRISLVSGLPKQVATLTSVHEYGHTWLFDNLRSHRLSQDATEGFCELLAYKYATEKGDKFYMQDCLRNPYTRGQIDAFVAAEKAYGFARIIQWIKEGEGDHIDKKDLARILVKPRPDVPNAQPVVAVINPPVFEGIPVFPPLTYTNVILKGLSGNAPRRFAIINGETFAPNESGKVRMGGSNLTLHCLEIHQNSVVIQLQGETASRTLSLNNFAP